MHPQYCNRTTTAIIMTKEKFAELQFRHQESGKTLKEYLREITIRDKQFIFNIENSMRQHIRQIEKSSPITLKMRSFA